MTDTTSTDQTVPTDEHHRPATTSITEGQSPCPACGIAVSPEDLLDPDPSASSTLARTAHLRPGLPDPSGRTEEATFTRCDTCRGRAADAAALGASSRVLTRSRGRAGAGGALMAAHDVLAAAGLPVPGEDNTHDDDTLVMLVDLLAPFAPAVRWAARWTAGEVGSSVASTEPFAVVDEDLRSSIRRAWGRVLQARIARTLPPARITSPDGSGCLMCGTSAVVVDAATVAAEGSEQAARVARWSPLKAPSSVLGGPGSNSPLIGYTCKRCTSAIAETGAVGITAMETSLRWYLTSQARTDEAEVVRAHTDAGMRSGIIAWAAQVLREQRRGEPGRDPNREPWEHLSLDTEVSDTNTNSTDQGDEHD